MSSTTSNIKVNCSTKNLKEIRTFVEASLKELSVPANEIGMIVLAIDEICANFIIHSNQCNEEQEIEILIKNENQGVSIEILDEGEYFDLSSYKEPDIQEIVKEKRKGGMGLILVKRIMDSIEFKKVNNHNVCRLFKKVKFA